MAISPNADDTQNEVYLYKFYNEEASVLSFSGTTAVSSSKVTLNLSGGTQSFGSDGSANSWTGNSSFSVARTPYIQSQLFGSGRKNLFRIYTRSHGSPMNTKFYITIQNVKAAAANNTSPNYAQFDLSVYVKNESDGTFSSPETFNGLNLDPDSSQYVVNVIGDAFSETDSTGRITKYGNYGNGSKHIRIGDY